MKLSIFTGHGGGKGVEVGTGRFCNSLPDLVTVTVKLQTAVLRSRSL